VSITQVQKQIRHCYKEERLGEISLETDLKIRLTYHNESTHSHNHCRITESQLLSEDSTGDRSENLAE